MKMQRHNLVITQDQLNACIARMKSEPFRAADIALIAEQNGVPKDPAYRVADRLIQKFRKSRNVTVNYNHQYPTWTWVA
jgi:hypothetical protein